MSTTVNDKETIEYRTSFPTGYRVASVASMFDLEAGEDRVNTISYTAPPSASEDWTIGLIVGPSGSGKSSVARKHFDADIFRGHAWSSGPIINDFADDLSVETIIKAFSSVGLNAPPLWLQAYETLSNGEKFRADLARAIVERKSGLLVYDEYTSVVDRTVAKVASAAVNKFYRSSDVGKFIALSCHYDIVDWLAPDWVLDMRTGEVARRRLRRPRFTLDIFYCERSLWRIFKKYHYLTGSLASANRPYVGIVDGTPAAFIATLQSAGHKGSRSVHRLVVLPEFQGVGIGSKLAGAIAEYETTRLGLRSFSISTSNAYFARALVKSGKFRIREKIRTGLSAGKTSLQRNVAGFGKPGRARTALVYVPPER